MVRRFELLAVSLECAVSENTGNAVFGNFVHFLCESLEE
jgi:hypothetical protein